jgi:hypothetical protein
MTTHQYEAYAYENEVLVGQQEFSRLEVIRRFNTASRFEMTVPITKLLAGINFGYKTKFDIREDGIIIFTGRVIHTNRVWNNSTNNPVDEVSVTGRDGLYFLGGRLAVPVPSGPPYTSSAYDTRTGPAETIMKQFVSYNAGSNATLPRSFSWLTIGTDLTRGVSLTAKARFENLMDILTGIANVSGLGFQTVADVFDIYVPADKRASVRFSPDLGNLSSLEYTLDIATANYFVCGGGGDLTARTFYEEGDSDSIILCGRLEEFADRRDTTDTTIMHTEILSRFENTLQKVQLHVEPIELPTMRFNTDFYLGDTVDVDVDGTWISSQVQEAGLVVNQEGIKTRFELGQFGLSQAELNKSPYARRVNFLERSK